MRALRNGFSLCLTLMVVLLSPWAAPANAQHSRSTKDMASYGPWARDVSQEQQRAAHALFNEGNSLLEESLYVKAAEKYRQALEHWKHPAIHYNLALALMNVDHPTELHQNLVAATRYGPGPLDAEKYKHALDYKALLEKQLTWVDITCEVPGATVTLDGRTLFVAPGHYEGLVHPGVHSIVAVKQGYVFVGKSRTMTLNPSERVSLNLKLYTADQVTQYKTRWSAWMPWAVMGSGVAVAAGGGLLHQQASKDYGVFDAGIQKCGGCDPRPDGLTDARARGDNLQRAAFGAYALGGAALVTGAVLIYLNQPQPIQVEPSETQAVNVTPLLGGTNGVLATFRF